MIVLLEPVAPSLQADGNTYAYNKFSTGTLRIFGGGGVSHNGTVLPERLNGGSHGVMKDGLKFLPVTEYFQTRQSGNMPCYYFPPKPRKASDGRPSNGVCISGRNRR